MNKVRYVRWQVTIGWESQQSWRGYDIYCRDHPGSTDAERLKNRTMSVCYHVRQKQMPTEWRYGLPSRRNRNTFSLRNELKQRPAYIPIKFFNERREVGKRSKIVMFGNPSIENFVQFCLSLLLHLGIADHRQEECSKYRSRGIRSR